MEHICYHEDSVKWNPENHVVQCHRCGKVMTPSKRVCSDEPTCSHIGPQTPTLPETYPVPLKRYDTCPICGVSEAEIDKAIKSHSAVLKSRQALYNAFLWLYNVLVQNIGKSGEEPSVEERDAAVESARKILQEQANDNL